MGRTVHIISLDHNEILPSLGRLGELDIDKSHKTTHLLVDILAVPLKPSQAQLLLSCAPQRVNQFFWEPEPDVSTKEDYLKPVICQNPFSSFLAAVPGELVLEIFQYLDFQSIFV